MNEPHVKFERRDIVARYVFYFAGAMIVLAILMQFGLSALASIFTRMDGGTERPVISNANRPPEPQLQEDEAADLAAVKHDETTRLNSYGWIDRRENRVHIPIDRAMDAITKNGLPHWDHENAKNSKQQDGNDAPKTEAPK